MDCIYAGPKRRRAIGRYKVVEKVADKNRDRTPRLWLQCRWVTTTAYQSVAYLSRTNLCLFSGFRPEGIYAKSWAACTRGDGGTYCKSSVAAGPEPHTSPTEDAAISRSNPQVYSQVASCSLDAISIYASCLSYTTEHRNPRRHPRPPTLERSAAATGRRSDRLPVLPLPFSGLLDAPVAPYPDVLLVLSLRSSILPRLRPTPPLVLAALFHASAATH